MPQNRLRLTSLAFTFVHLCLSLSLPCPPSLLALSTLHSCRLFRNHNALSSSDPNQTSLQLDTKQALQRRGERGKVPGNKTSKSTVCECKRSSRLDAIVCAPRAGNSSISVASWSVKWGYARAAASSASGVVTAAACATCFFLAFCVIYEERF